MINNKFTRFLNRANSKKLLAAASILLIVVTACNAGVPTPPAVTDGGAPRPTPVRTPTAVPASDEEAVRQLINAECEAVVQQDIDRLQSMWSTTGVVTDANHTKDNASDDVTWKNWDALRDRYVNVIFPSNPTFCQHNDIQVQLALPNATATTGVNIGVTNCQNCNIWTFTKGTDGWKIASLTYNLNPQ